jgi:rubrerythrin
MILLKPELVKRLAAPSGPQDIWPALQQAIELEHATIPPYLYAKYSLMTSNAPISSIIDSVVIEEMLHMTLASNVLNALGGSPAIGQPGFIPTYPGPLPGGVESGLIVHLAPFSPAQLQAFLTIEEPEDPLAIPTQTAALAATGAAQPITIGQFYLAISAAIGMLGDGAFVDPPRNQIGPDIMTESPVMQNAVVVTDVATAQQAINTIIEQGEGTTTSPEEVVGTFGPAHYYRYMQIQKGGLLVENPPGSGNFVYDTVNYPVTFDPSGVYPLPTDPTASGYSGAQALANDNFNYAYTSLLIALNTFFNGVNTEDQFNVVIGLMMSLKGQARAMMAGIPNPSVFTGPSFEYQPVNPLND